MLKFFYYFIYNRIQAITNNNNSKLTFMYHKDIFKYTSISNKYIISHIYKYKLDQIKAFLNTI